MRDKTFIKLALAWSVVGIFLLILVANFTAPPEVNIIDLERNIGKNIVVKGVVDRTSYKEKVSFIDLQDNTGKITVVVFEDLPNKVYKNDKIRVVVTDIRMPNKDGNDVARYVRESLRKRYIPVIAITGYIDEAESELFTHLFEKPFKIKELVDVIKSFH